MNGRRSRQRRRTKAMEVAARPILGRRLQRELDKARDAREAAVAQIRADYFRARRDLEAARLHAERTAHERYDEKHAEILARARDRGPEILEGKPA